MTDSDRLPRDGLDVLVVEDNPGDVRLIREGFDQSRVDSSLSVVTDGETALDYLHRRNGYETATKPDLVLLDLNLPRKSGDVILEAVKRDSELRAIPVLVLSSSEAENHVRDTYERGAEGYLVKPVDPNEFLSLVETIAESVTASRTLPEGKFDAIDVSE